MRCVAGKRAGKARGAADIGYIGQPRNAAGALSGRSPQGRGDSGALLCWSPLP
jgi:hypothetical protein